MFVMHPHIRLIMVVFMFPTAWNNFSNAMLTVTMSVKANATTEEQTPSSMTASYEVNIRRKTGMIVIQQTVITTP